MKTVRIKFVNPMYKIPDDGRDWFNDETEYDVEDEGELAVLFLGFLKENGLVEIEEDEEEEDRSAERPWDYSRHFE